MLVTAETMVTHVRQLSNMENRLTVEDPEIHSYLTKARKRLTSMLVRHGLVRAETTATITATGAGVYAFPSDFFSTISVFRVDGDRVHELKLIDSGVRLTPSATPTGQAQAYYATDAGIVLYPAPPSGTYYHVYVPDPGEVTYESTVNYPMGWEEYMEVDAAIQCLSKEETINPVLNQRRTDIVRAIQDEASMRNLREPYRLVDRRPGRRGSVDGFQDPADVWWALGI